MSLRPVRFGHIGLAARDLERMVAWYVDVLDMQISDRMTFPPDSAFDEGVWLRINTDHHVISMFGLRDPGEPRGRAVTAGVHHIGFEVASFDDLLSVLHHAREHGVAVQDTRSGGPGNQLRVYLYDPEDNIVELYYAMDQIGWDGTTRPFPPVEHADLEAFDVDAWLEWKGPEFRTRAGG
ncbi:MAG TPA: VOC family protein [Solirubrobacteraceae bacterium]|nr:VOC family protein [Solirubrobacteraceae bacterium]